MKHLEDLRGHPFRSGTEQCGTASIPRPWLPSVSTARSFPPVDAAPVLAGVKQIALDVGCESALRQGGGNGPEDGSGGLPWRA
jgi:hypothetical protein